VLRPFTLHRPRSLEEACELLTRLEPEDVVPYAGGTELLLLMKEGLRRPRHLVDLKRIPGLDVIGGDRSLAIGATVTHRALERSALVQARYPLVSAVARHVANVRVRNVGTVGGNLAFADPHSDLATLFLAFDASVELRSPRGHRELSIDAFVRGPWDTVREADELLVAVRLAPWSGRTAAVYVKFGLYERPTLGIAVTLRLDEGDRPRGVADADRRRVAEARIAVGCINPRPARVRDAEARLGGCTIADLEEASRAVAELVAAGVDPADDLHGAADYKRELAAAFTRRALGVAAARARGQEPRSRYTHAVVA
jgi:aerobic carbon-monoxide dehydrogenase medium subunit